MKKTGAQPQHTQTPAIATGRLGHASISVITFISILFLAGCNYTVQKIRAPQTEKVATVPDFATVEKEVLSVRCTECHRARGLFDTSDYSLVKGLAKEIRQRILLLGPGQMPPANAQPMSVGERSLLLAWLDAGAPFEKPAPGASPTPQPTSTPAATPSPQPTPSPVPSGPIPSYAQLRANILDKKCLSCHSDPSDGAEAKDLRDYKDFKKYARGIRLRVLADASDRRRMPPLDPTLNAPQLTPEELKQLVDWIDAGAPEFGLGAEPEPDTLRPTYTSIKKHIFDAKCVRCHNGDRFAERRYPLNNLGGILIIEKEAIALKDPSKTKLIRAVTKENENDRMPPAPSEPLSQQEIDVLKAWFTDNCPL